LAAAAAGRDAFREKLGRAVSARGVLLLALLFMGTARAQENPCDKPVVPIPAEGESVVQAEHDWLRKTYGGGAVVRQTLGTSPDGKRRYDLVAWRRPDGQVVNVCFDVSTVFEETIRKVEEEETGDSRRPAR
jgi:hypothetical protein